MKYLNGYLALLCSMLLVGCTNIYVGEESKTSLAQTYFGLVRVTVYENNTQQHNLSLDVESFGAWALIDTRPMNDSMLGGGLGIGYKKTQRLKISKNCQLVVMVYTQAELSKLVDVLKLNAIDGDNVCALQRSP